MREQFLIPLAEWKSGRFGFEITNTTLVKYGKLGYINPKPEKVRGRWCVDRSAIYVGPSAVGVAPEIHEDDDEALKEILNHVTKATKK
ncbi:TPA: excisionase [Enterobacter cloacae]|uniref:excisionase n=1 Tax=Enterobacter cloacae complex TaxID=354276 RepID=UPI00217606FD|nr:MULTISPECIES: excisionase [Enterobacter cloacae complex]MCY0772674.1 excisionase [Enterobacter cloacae complex sp. 2022EL-00788]UWA67261.1 excisionase [Enterobacter cloacae]HAS1050769.1 excisionase [Enterobacter cloacae]HAS1097320.1 excisionase [Enterobacter cloacae]